MVEQPPKQEMLEHNVDPSNKSNISNSENQASTGGHSENLNINDPKKVGTVAQRPAKDIVMEDNISL